MEKPNRSCKSKDATIYFEHAEQNRCEIKPTSVEINLGSCKH